MRRLEVWTRLALVAWAMAITMARAVRYPNDFAEAHWLLDYRFGIIRRGFAGFGCVWLCAATDGSTPAAGRRWLLAAAVPVVVANILAGSPLMDGQVERFSTPTRLILYLPFLAGAAVAVADDWRRG